MNCATNHENTPVNCHSFSKHFLFQEMVTIAFNLATVAIGFVSAIALLALAGLSPDKKT